MNSLCQLASDWHGTLPAEGLSAEVKIDGWRCAYFRGADGQPRLWSRNGLPLEGAAHVFARLQRMEAAAGAPMVFDGEIQVGGTLDATKRWFESGWKLGGAAGVFHAFDCLPFAEWKRGGTDQPLYQRKARLRELWSATEEAGDGWTWSEGSKGAEAAPAVVLIADSWVVDAAHVLDEARRVWAGGGEGLMLKDAEGGYRRNRSGSWLKVKLDGPWWRKLGADVTPTAV